MAHAVYPDLEGKVVLVTGGAAGIGAAMVEAGGLSLLVAGPFGSGLLASGSADAGTYNHARAAPGALERLRRIDGCAPDPTPWSISPRSPGS